MIFRKASSSTNTPTKFSETPSQWSSIEDLLNGNNEEFTNFNFSGVESNWQNPEFSDVSKSSESPQVFPKHLPAPRGFAEGGEVTPSDISTEIEPVTETIQNPSLSAEEDNTVDALETLAREIYSRLRQRVEIEQERYGSYLGRIPW
jgi:FtsZ-binding cell division protein ZapB